MSRRCRLRNIFILLVPLCLSPTLASSAENLFQDAKLAMFDQRWEYALDRLDELQRDYPKSGLIPQSHFYQARALEKLGRKEPSLLRYESFLSLGPSITALETEAKYSVARLSCELYEAGNRAYIDRAYSALEDPNSELRLVAAVQLSYVSDSRVNRRAVPILQESVSNSRDSEVQNQATLALLRIDPKLLGEDRSKGSAANSSKRLHVVISEGGAESFKMSLPLSLTQLLISALPDEAKEHLRAKGLNPDNLLDELSKADEILEVRDGETSIKIWVK
ncbi:MAG: hypothetical protein JSU96_18045 [Acidobacteriota bacterium]|nr:MAG: hypothetical protein JSU96_18045 [Acidobacteriota bacterium]